MEFPLNSPHLTAQSVGGVAKKLPAVKWIMFLKKDSIKILFEDIIHLIAGGFLATPPTHWAIKWGLLSGNST